MSGLSPAAGEETVGLIEKETYSTTNVELRNSFYFICKKEQSEATSTIRQSSIFIRHSMKFRLTTDSGLRPLT
jgi:hypothetical protein